MLDFWTVTIPILVVDVANPVLLAAVILALTTGRPVATALAVIAGHTVAYFVAGALILYGLVDLLKPLLQPVLDWFSNPSSVDFAISGIIGLALLVVAWRWKVAPPKPSEKEPEQVTTGIVPAFLFGAALNFVGIPFAIPYFGFLGNLFRVEGDTLQLTLLVIYNLLYSVPFLLMPLAIVVFGRGIMTTLNKINAAVEKYAAYIMPVLIGLVGLGLTVDAGLYFLTGEGLI